jgi:alkylhydroperoxidase family enzyme
VPGGRTGRPRNVLAGTGKRGACLGRYGRNSALCQIFYRVLANAPVALESYVNFSAALAGGTRDDRIRKQIALAVAETNLCGYCRSAVAS